MAFASNITLKRTTPRNMVLAGRIRGTVSQALRWLGKEHVSDETVWLFKRDFPMEIAEC